MQFGKGLKAMMAIREVDRNKLATATGISLWNISMAAAGRLNLKREQEDKIRMELCWPKEIDHLLDKVEGFQYER
jgi:DNA-binding Xre family transcriptional regulator